MQPSVDPQEEIAALVEFEGRGPGTDAERRAARHLEQRLAELGREAEVENVDTWPRWPLAWALYLTVAVIGSILAVASPIAGAAVVVAAALCIFLEATQIIPLVRRLFGRRASQNVLSREDEDKPGTIVLVARVDAPRERAAFARAWSIPFWALIAVLVCCIARAAGAEGSALTAAQFVPTVVLILAIALLIDVMLSPVSARAEDTTGVVAALALAERHGGALGHFDLWVLLTGAQNSLSDGMRAFMRRHRRGLDRGRTVFVNLEPGAVGYTRREGFLLPTRSHSQLLQLCDEIEEDDPDGQAFGAQPVVRRRPSDAIAARLGGFSAITIGCGDARGTAFCSELLERLDADVGPALSEREPRASRPAP